MKKLSRKIIAIILIVAIIIALTLVFTKTIPVLVFWLVAGVAYLVSTQFKKK